MEKPKTINFVVTANLADSLARITLEWSKQLVNKKYRIIISYPFISHIDFIRWNISQKVNNSNYKNTKYSFLLLIKLVRIYKLRLFSGIIKFIFGLYKWEGRKMGSIPMEINFNPFFILPTNQNMPVADYLIVINGCYFIPHLIHLSKDKGEIIGSLHINYLAAKNDPSPVVRGWLEHDLAISKKLNIRILAESQRSKKAAEDLGVKIDDCIPPGVNCEEFSDSGRRGNISPIVILLFCATKPQKGLDFGCDVIAKLREDSTVLEKVKFYSVGCPENQMKPEYRDLFDFHYGYLHRNDFRDALKEADIFLWPEQYSGFASPPLQAMACGCALVTTYIDGTEEYATHEENSMTAMPDDLEKMENNVKRLILDTELRDKIRENGLLTVKNYTWEAAGDKLVKFLNEPAPIIDN